MCLGVLTPIFIRIAYRSRQKKWAEREMAALFGETPKEPFSSIILVVQMVVMVATLIGMIWWLANLRAVFLLLLQRLFPFLSLGVFFVACGVSSLVFLIQAPMLKGRRRRRHISETLYLVVSLILYCPFIGLTASPLVWRWAGTLGNIIVFVLGFGLVFANLWWLYTLLGHPSHWWVRSAFIRGETHIALRRLALIGEALPGYNHRDRLRYTILTHMNRLDDVEAELRAVQLLTKDANHRAAALEQWGWMRLAQGQHEAAWHGFRRSLEVSPTRPGAMAGLAEVLAMTDGDLDAAKAAIEFAIQTRKRAMVRDLLFPKERMLYRATLSWVLAASNDPQGAHQEAQAIEADLKPSADPRVQAARVRLARAMLAIGERSEARRHLSVVTESATEGLSASQAGALLEACTAS